MNAMWLPDSPILRLAWLKRLSGGGGERRVNIDPHLVLTHYVNRNNNDPPFATIEGTINSYACTVNFSDDSGDGRFARDANQFYPDEHVYPVMLPAWADKLIVTLPDQRIKATVHWTNTKLSGGWSDRFIRSVYFVLPWASEVPTGDREILRPNDGENSFYLNLYINSNVLELTQEIIDQVTVTAVREA